MAAALRLGLSLREALILAPGEWADLLQVIKPPKPDDETKWEEGEE